MQSCLALRSSCRANGLRRILSFDISNSLHTHDSTPPTVKQTRLCICSLRLEKVCCAASTSPVTPSWHSPSVSHCDYIFPVLTVRSRLYRLFLFFTHRGPPKGFRPREHGLQSNDGERKYSAPQPFVQSQRPGQVEPSHQPATKQGSAMLVNEETRDYLLSIFFTHVHVSAQSIELV